VRNEKFELKRFFLFLIEAKKQIKKPFRAMKNMGTKCTQYCKSWNFYCIL